MIVGAHTVIYSTNPDQDRAFFRDVLQLPSVDVGDGWLIFGLPPAEVAVHPSEKNDVHEFYLMCDDVKVFVDEMKKHNITCGPVQEEGWGLLTELTLPGGGQAGRLPAAAQTAHGDAMTGKGLSYHGPLFTLGCADHSCL